MSALTVADHGVESRLSAGRRLKVLQVAAAGITVRKLLLHLIDRLEAEGCEVHIACSPGGAADELTARGYRVAAIPIARRISPISNLLSVWRLYRHMRRGRFDVVHVHTPVAAALGRVAAKLARVPIVIYTAHGFYFHDNMPSRVRRPLVWVERLLGTITDMILTQSSEDAVTAVRERIGPAARVRAIGNGVDLSRFGCDPGTSSPRLPGVSPGDRVVGYTGRLVAEKGITDLIRAMGLVVRTMHRTKLLLVGGLLDSDRDRSLEKALQETIDENGLSSHVILTGFVDDVSRYMAAMDLFVLPSYREGMPRTIIEAMASGKPVVATAIRGCREEVVHEVTGLLVPVKDPDALAHAILRIISDPELARRMGEAGRRRAEQMFDEDAVVARQIDIYRELAGGMIDAAR